MPHYDDIEPEKQLKQVKGTSNPVFEQKGNKTISKKMNLWALMDVMEQWQNSKK